MCHQTTCSKKGANFSLFYELQGRALKKTRKFLYCRRNLVINFCFYRPNDPYFSVYRPVNAFVSQRYICALDTVRLLIIQIATYTFAAHGRSLLVAALAQQIRPCVSGRPLRYVRAWHARVSNMQRMQHAFLRLCRIILLSAHRRCILSFGVTFMSFVPSLQINFASCLHTVISLFHIISYNLPLIHNLMISKI